VKSRRWSFPLFSVLAMGLLFPVAGLAAQNPTHRAVLAQKYRTHFVIYDVQKKTTTTLFTLEGEWHAPNWTPDGRYLISDMGGALYRIPVSGANKGKPGKIYASRNMIATNDHALSWDGRQIAITDIALPIPAKMRSPADLRNPLFIMSMDGGNAREIHLGWVHGWSPNGKYVVYTQWDLNNYDIYRIDADGSGLLQMTTNKAEDDGPEYSPDGQWVYFCSNRSGKWDVWRMSADGAGPHGKFAEPVTSGGDTQDWFPHISRDGKWLYTLSYPMDRPDHTYIGPGMKIKLLRLHNGVAAKGARLTTVSTFFGGQGSGNTGGWAPDSKKFAWTEYETIPAK
jgi:Tol biopolymer transport system component